MYIVWHDYLVLVHVKQDTLRCMTGKCKCAYNKHCTSNNVQKDNGSHKRKKCNWKKSKKEKYVWRNQSTNMHHAQNAQGFCRRRSHRSNIMKLIHSFLSFANLTMMLWLSKQSINNKATTLYYIMIMKKVDIYILYSLLIYLLLTHPLLVHIAINGWPMVLPHGTLAR